MIDEKLLRSGIKKKRVVKTLLYVFNCGRFCFGPMKNNSHENKFV